MNTWQRLIVVYAISVTYVAACASGGIEDADSVVGSLSESLDLSQSCNDNLNDVYSRPTKLSAYNSNQRGKIVRCAAGRTIALDELSSALASRGFAQPDLKNPVRLYRISYRTERLSHQPDVSSALLAIPTVSPTVSQSASDLSRNRQRPPLIVYGHGTVPYGPTCADSRLDPIRDTMDLELGVVLAFAGHGFPVIMPDYAGFVAGSPVTGYILSEDEAHALLDATRAMQGLLSNPPDRVVLVGHSQGGHAVLSAQALAGSYGLSGQLSGVVAFAPFWAVGRSFGTIISPDVGYNTRDEAGQISFAIEYFYTHAELYDGPGRGAQLFQPQVRAALQSFVSTCQFDADPSVLGATTSDFMQPDFLNAVGPCGLLGGDQCKSGLAKTWEQRFRADRPKLDASGAPVLMWQGAQDVVIPPTVAKCGIDKITADLSAGRTSAKFTFCGDAAADHETVESDNLGWVTKWIEARTLGSADPGSCPGQSAIQGEGGPLTCVDPPGNVD